MARGPRWVPVRPLAVPSQGAPPTATSTRPARRSSGVRQTGAFMKVWMPLQSISASRRLTRIGPGRRASGPCSDIGPPGSGGRDVAGGDRGAPRAGHVEVRDERERRDARLLLSEHGVLADRLQEPLAELRAGLD